MPETNELPLGDDLLVANLQQALDCALALHDRAWLFADPAFRPDPAPDWDGDGRMVLMPLPPRPDPSPNWRPEPDDQALSESMWAAEAAILPLMHEFIEVSSVPVTCRGKSGLTAFAVLLEIGREMVIQVLDGGCSLSGQEQAADWSRLRVALVFEARLVERRRREREVAARGRRAKVGETPCPAFLGLKINQVNRTIVRAGFKEVAEFKRKEKPWLLFVALFEAGENGKTRAELETELLGESIPNSLDQRKKACNDVLLQLQIGVDADQRGLWRLTGF